MSWLGGIYPGQYWPFAPSGTPAAAGGVIAIHAATVAIYPTHDATLDLAEPHSATVWIWPSAGVSVVNSYTCDNDHYTTDSTAGTADDGLLE